MNEEITKLIKLVRWIIIAGIAVVILWLLTAPSSPY
jgi:hypothetical protein